MSQTLQLILCLSILVFLHELGHFLPARWFNTRVERFYLFFDSIFFFPVVNRFRFTLFKKKVGQTEFGLGWFPFGGYVNIVGMFGEPEEPEEIAAEAGVPDNEKFRNKKPWQRMIILAGGITVNLILGYLLFVMILNVWGEDIQPIGNLKQGIACDSLARAHGLRDGDKILTVGGKTPETLDQAVLWMMLDNAEQLEVDRDGQKVAVSLPEDIEYKMVATNMKLVSPRMPFIIDSVMPRTVAHWGGLKKGDQVVRLNGDTIPYFHLWREKLVPLRKKVAVVGVIRDGSYREFKLWVNESATIGVYPKSSVGHYGLKHKAYSFGSSLGRGWEKTTERLVNYVKQFKLVFTKAGAKQIGGIAAIGSLFPEELNWQAFWTLTATLSVILAFMNLLPIPVFDGGYMLFTLWEMVTRRKVPDKVMKHSLTVGMWIVLALFLYSNGNDLYRMVLSKYL
ncbi:MAG: regulator of sigma E protease [Bacteroidetes bacterium]|nr:MAG: regulator of sigma E protease [Bacteroidota bacterium]